MTSRFPGFPPEGIKFFRGLARNNSREWFLPRKPLFEEQVRDPMRRLVEAVNAELRRFGPDYVTDPAKAIYRLYRDTRFSKDKTPYKDHIAASFNHRGLQGEEPAGHYFQVSHKDVGIGGGVYMPDPATLRAIRGHIAEHHAELRRILKGAAIRRLFGEMQGEQLTRPPKGWLPDHPAADLLRYKQFLLWSELPPAIATTEDLFREIVQRFRAQQPFLDFLNAPLAAKPKKIDARDLLV